MDEHMTTVGARIRELRRSRGISQGWLANHLGISRATLYKIEQGNADLRVSLLVAVSKFFAVSTDVLLGVSDTTPAGRAERKQGNAPPPGRDAV